LKSNDIYSSYQVNIK